MLVNGNLIAKIAIVAAILTVALPPSVAADAGPTSPSAIEIGTFNQVNFSWPKGGKGQYPRHSKPYRSSRPHISRGHKKHHGRGSFGGHYKLKKFFDLGSPYAPYGTHRRHHKPHYKGYQKTPNSWEGYGAYGAYGNQGDPYGAVCQRVERFYYLNGRKALVGGTACRDSYGGFVLVPQSRYIIRYY